MKPALSRNIYTSPFRAGTVFNPVDLYHGVKLMPKFRHIILQYPSRLNAMAIDPSKIDMRDDMRYTPGEVIFSIGIYKYISVVLRRDSRIVISPSSLRPALISHAAILMRKALHTNQGFEINVDNSKEIRHCGLGSSSGLISGVASAINELYGNPVPSQKLIRYLAQNHGEEIDGKKNILNPVQCIGGSAAAGLCRGGIIVIAGENIPIAIGKIPDTYKIVIGIPKNIPHLDSKALMDAERKQLPKFVAAGRRYGQKNAYNVLHTMLPAIQSGDMSVIGDVIYDYRFRMGSIKNCSFTYPPMVMIAKHLSYLKEKSIAEVLAISSVGPAFFALTSNPIKCVEAFEKENLTIYQTKINNNGYIINSKISV